MTAPIKLHAYAKVNLVLDVTARLKDGYHALDTVMLRLGLHDRLYFSPAKRAEVLYRNIPCPKGDIVSRAIEGYAKLAGRACMARVEVEKHIPMEAGLAGGSANAAAVLLALQVAYGALDEAALNSLALSLGADVPYCLQQLPCRARNKGEALTPLMPPREPLWFLLVKPAHGISTGALFRSLDMAALPHPNVGAAVRALEGGDPAALGACMHNALEAPAARLMPELGALKERLLATGALGACMTGAGSTMVGLFASREEAHAAEATLMDAPFHAVARSL